MRVARTLLASLLLGGAGPMLAALSAPAQAGECVEVRTYENGSTGYPVPWNCVGPALWPDECAWTDPTVDDTGAGVTVCVATPV